LSLFAPCLAVVLNPGDGKSSGAKGERMATYVVLFNWTEQGIKSYKDSPSRVDAAQEAFADLGIDIKEIYWTLGAYDLVSVFEAPDDESVTAAMLRLGSLGNVRTTTMRAFPRGEFEAIAGRAAG
jgi:uncharacterized protein with GYD domain